MASRAYRVEAEVEDQRRGLMSISLEPTPPVSPGLRPIKRPNFGTKGRKISLVANFYPMEFRDLQIHHYDIAIEGDPRDRTFKRNLVNAMMADNPRIFGHVYHAFDGNKNLYSAGPLNLPHGQHKFNVQPRGRDRTFEMKIQHVGADGGVINLHGLSLFLEGKVSSLSPEVLNVLDIILQQIPAARHFGIGKYFFTSAEERASNWGPGLQQWQGYYSSVRPGWKYLFAQIDISVRIFHKEQMLIDFIAEVLGVNEVRRLDDWAVKIVNDKLDALNVEVIHLSNVRTFRAIKLTKKRCDEIEFTLEQEGKEKRRVTVARYFEETYPNCPLKYRQLPCVQVQPVHLHRYFPIDVCRVKKGQQYTKMSSSQKSDLIRASAIPAAARRHKINSVVRERNFDRDPFARQFGLSISRDMQALEGRVLDAPTLLYSNDTVVPRDGSWRQNSPYYVKGTVTGMMVVTFGTTVTDPSVRVFVESLQRIGREKGIFMPDPVRCICCTHPNRIEKIIAETKERCPNLNLVLAVLCDRDASNNTDFYNQLKKAGDTRLGIASQAVQGVNMKSCKPQTLANICLKINAKVGGTNNVINPKSVDCRRDQFLTIFAKEPVMVFGADITHPAPRNKQHPSIAAVVASYNQNLTRYAAVIGVQGHREEIIVNLEDHVHELLLHFYRCTKQRKPTKIIFYRDGVGEGQFDQVLVREMSGIQRACLKLERGYQPKITLVVVQKRHHARLFPVDPRDESGRAGNVPPGTTVDRVITNPIEFDFYLNSHQGIQGTCKPAHYHVLWDDNGFTADELQEMIFQLCHLYARCTRSVSIPAPAYYAHLVAFRARVYLDALHELGTLPEEADKVLQALKQMNTDCQPHRSMGPCMFFV